MNCLIILLLLNCCGGRNCGCGNSNCGRGQTGSRTGRNRSECSCNQSGERASERRAEERREEKSCDIPGMIPPPWQEYPMPRRESCDCENER